MTVDQLVHTSLDRLVYSMPRERYQAMDPEKKARLLDAATREFAAHGYELASINTILDDAGLSKGSFYYYFDDKADLAATVLISLSEPLMQLTEFRPVATPDAFWAELRRVSLIQLKALESKRVPFEAVTRLSNALAKDPELAAKVMPSFAPRVQATMRFLQSGVDVGALRRDVPLPMLTALIQSTKQAAYAARFPHDVVPTEAELEDFSELVFDLAYRLCTPKRGDA